MKRLFGNKKRGWELVFQLVLIAIVFFFFSFKRKKGDLELHIELADTLTFLTYVIAALIIGFIFLRVFLYAKKYLLFIFSTVALITLIIVFEETFLEPIFYADTRAKHFPGVIFSLLETIPTILILVGFKFAWDAISKQRELEHLELAVKESELQFLKTQINPHFLFNNLNNIYGYALEQSTKTPELILELSGVLRYMLYDCKEEHVMLETELEQLKNFIHLNELQIEGRGDVNFEVNGNIAQYKVAPLVLMVFVENAFKHSASSQNDQIKIKISCELKEDGEFKFFCENSFEKKSNTTDLAKGIGLENVVKRLELLYPDAHDLNISEEKGLYRVLLMLKLSEEKR